MPPLRRAQIHKIARHLGLAVNGDVLSAGQPVERDAMTLPAEKQFEPVMDQPFGM